MKKIISLKMAEITLFIYIAVVLIFALLPIDGQNVICKNADFRLVNGSCYGVLPLEKDWTKAKDTCTSLNGKLATFDSPEDMAKIFVTLFIPKNEALVVGTPRDAQETGDFWIGDSQNTNVHYYTQPEICKPRLYALRSLCMEINNSTPMNNPTTTSTPPIPKASCLYQDSILIDGQCYRLSTGLFTWPNAKQYCESWNGKVATISSVEQGMKILAPLGYLVNTIWAITDPLRTDVGHFVYLEQEGSCKRYKYGYSLVEGSDLQVLCME